MRNAFDRQLDQLHKELTKMGALCENAIAMATKALKNGDNSLALKAMDIEKEIDQKENDIEALCLRILLSQQPVASDLRQVSAALKMITDMERIGDQAEDIAEIISMNRLTQYADAINSGDMARTVIDMVTKCVESYVKQDIELAKEVIAQDDEADRLFVEAKNQLIQMIVENPDLGEVALDLLMISKYFERIGDHAENIAEWVIFSITGTHK